MAERLLMKGNEAIGEAAIRAGVRYYFGYPITPQSELLEYMGRRLPEIGGVFLQSESELAAISMVYGAVAAGKRAMTSSSSPGISLMQEGLTYMASAELPAFIVNISRGGPGLGRITPAQSDYFQATRGGGNGDYHLLVFAPASVQEMADLTMLALELGDKYRTPTMLLGDSIVGQGMEAVRFKEDIPAPPEKPWAATGPMGRERNLILSAPFTDPELITLNRRLQAKYQEIAARETRYEEIYVEDAQIVVVAFGIVSRFALEAIENLREEGYKIGLLRPITLWPFPEKPLRQLAGRVESFLVVEMNEGQMVQDVRLAVEGGAPVHFYGQGGGFITGPAEIEAELRKLLRVGGGEK
ncbi:MAG: 3-methyl-2-oxobutanoate dehydrogenase subunit VorB [bacterium]|jgi:2-oxoglutarate ferredoxin oxidoreductase subunit alpha